MGTLPSNELPLPQAPAAENPEAQAEKPFAEKLTTKVKDAVTGYLKNLDPRGKNWEWYVGAVGSAGLSAFLAINTGGTSVLAKSLLTAAGSSLFYAFDRGLLSHKENKLKKEYRGQELAEKIAYMNEKHEKGMGRISKFLGAVTVGSITGAALGSAASSLDIGLPKVDTQGTQAAVTEKLATITDNAKDVVSNVAEKAVDQAQENFGPAAAEAQQLVETAGNAIDTAKETGANVQDAINDVRENITSVQDAVQTIQDLPDHLPDQKGSIAPYATIAATTVVRRGMFSGISSFARGLFSRKSEK